MGTKQRFFNGGTNFKVLQASIGLRVGYSPVNPLGSLGEFYELPKGSWGRALAKNKFDSL